MIALQTVYSSDAELAASAQMPGADQLSTLHNSAGISAVINFWGGLYDIDWLKNTKVPVFSAYGTEDKVVPIDRKDTSLYGSISIHKKATELHIPNGIKAFEGYSHELQKHFNPIFDPGSATKQRWREAGQAAADFLYKELF
ncbi:MAG: hypothetical protein JWQ30_779 [Sediminibacterium sp.]|nr:hypothetical protein [Sediminibacterium sp.]